MLCYGSRHYSDEDTIEKALLMWGPDVVIEGGAPGADSLCRKVAERLGIEVVEFPANWELYGKRAGPIRNQQMIDEGKPDQAISFQVNGSPMGPGSTDMSYRLDVHGIWREVIGSSN